QRPAAAIGQAEAQAAASRCGVRSGAKNCGAADAADDNDPSHIITAHRHSPNPARPRQTNRARPAGHSRTAAGDACGGGPRLPTKPRCQRKRPEANRLTLMGKYDQPVPVPPPLRDPVVTTETKHLGRRDQNGTEIKKGHASITREEIMKVFDCLPKKVRATLANSAHDWAAHWAVQSQGRGPLPLWQSGLSRPIPRKRCA